MKREFYSYLYSEINAREDVDKLAQIHTSEVTHDTLLSIYSQKIQEFTRKTLHFHKKPHVMTRYFQMYQEGSSIVDIATQADLSPCLMARLILESYFLSSDIEKHKIKSQISHIMKDPSLLEDERLRKELELCIERDDNYSPLIDKLKRVTGEKYETLLCEKLRSVDVPFMDEEEMRASGYPKTPDAKLLIPFAVNGFVVNWVDSKASFCDDFSMQTARDQFLSYVNRYGPGLVIYWFGFIEELNGMHQDGVLLMESFPETGLEFLNPPQFNFKCKNPDIGEENTTKNDNNIVNDSSNNVSKNELINKES